METRESMIKFWQENANRVSTRLAKVLDKSPLPSINVSFPVQVAPDGQIYVIDHSILTEAVGRNAANLAVKTVLSFIAVYTEQETGPANEGGVNDNLTMDSPNTSTLDSIRKDNEILQQRLNHAYQYIEELGGTVHPTEWPEYNSEDTLPWSTSPQ